MTPSLTPSKISERATREYAADDAARGSLLGAIEHLAAVMLPHLQREEGDAMPIVSQCMSKAEWAHWDQRYNLDTRSFAERVFGGLWLIDGAAEADQDFVRSLIPRPLSRVIEMVRSRDYDRRAYRCWYLPQHSHIRRQKPSGRVDVEVAAPPEAVWAVLTDPSRIPEWSHECCEVELLDSGPVGLGSRFRGGNRVGRNRWSRVCTVFRCEPASEFGYLTSGGPGDATAWHFRLEPTATGTRLTQLYRIVSMPAWMSVWVGVTMTSHNDRSAALREDLVRLAAIAEGVASAAWPNSRTGCDQT